ncbi:Ferritin-like protein [compost metagenome]
MLRGGAAEQLVKDDVISLQSLLFDSGISKEDWAKGLKQHSKTVTNLLLNNQTEELGNYIHNQFDPALLEAINPAARSQKTESPHSLIDKSSLMKLDYRPFLQEFLQLGILIEHSTIPPYLTALYSIQDGTNLLASQIIRSVVVEEMLHMIMVCNVMNAVSIQPSVNRPQNYPSYPMKLPLNVDFFVSLEKFSSNSIATFIAIESPSSPTVKAPVTDHGTEKVALFSRGLPEENNFWNVESLKDFLQKNVDTIGEFYDVLFFFIVVFQVLAFYKANGRLPQSFEELNKGGIFTGNPAKQIRPDQYYGSGGKLHTVEDLLGVMEVFQEIKGQGEGADDTIFDVDPSQFEEGAELAHYFRFKEVFHEHFYIGGNYEPFMDDQGMMPVTTPPVGKELLVDWNASYPMRTNVKLADYQSNPQLYAQGKAFNKTYKQLLDAIQAAVEGHAEELEKSIMYMYALKEQAVELMKQPLNGQENAGPTFEYPIN